MANIATELLQPAEHIPPGFASLSQGVFHASTILFPDVASFLDRQAQAGAGYSYGQNGTPTHYALAEKLSQLEGGGHTVLVPSGLAAIMLVSSCVLTAGDHVLLPESVYGPTRHVTRELFGKWGVRCSAYPNDIGAGIAQWCEARTRLVWVESPASNTLEMQDVPAIVQAAHALLGASSAFRLNLMAQNSGVPGRDEVENNRWGVAPSLAFGLGTATRVYIDYLHVKQNNIPDGGVSTIGLPGYSSPDPKRPWLANARPVDPSNFYGTDADHDHVKADLFTVRVEHDISDDLALHNTLRWGRTRQDYLLTSYMATAANLLTPNPNDPSTWTVARSNPTFKDQTNKILTDQFNFTANFQTGGITHNLSSGVELTREEANTTGIVSLLNTWPAASVYRPNPHVSGMQWFRNGTYTHGKTDTYSAYVFDTLKFNEQWQVNAGVRLDHYKTDFDSAVTCGTRNAPVCGALPANSAVPGLDARKSGNLTNWKVGVLYKPAANGSVYANYAISQQPPGGSTLTLSSSANSADNPNFNPQKARTAEVGTKWEFYDSRLMLTGAIYRTEINNDVVQDPTDLQYYQTGKKRVQGVELSAVGKLTEQWAISAGYTVMDSKVISGSKVSSDGSTDLAYTPKSAFTAWTTYTLPFGLTIGGGARYNDRLKRGTDGAIGTPAYTRSYWVFDAVATYPINKHVDLQLNVYNLFDKEYVAAINKSGYRYTPGAPRSAMLTANVRF